MSPILNVDNTVAVSVVLKSTGLFWIFTFFP